MTEIANFTRSSHKLAKSIEQDIAAGRFERDPRLPSVRQISLAHQVSCNTTLHALRELEHKGLIKINPRRRAVVLATAQSQFHRGVSTSQIGMIHSSRELDSRLNSPWGTEIQSAFQQTALENGHTISLLPFHPFDKTTAVFEKAMDELKTPLSVVFLFASPSNEKLLPILAERKIPWISVNRFNRQQMCNYVSTDNICVGQTVGRLFAQANYQRLCLLTTRLSQAQSSLDKAGGFIQSYLLANRPIDEIQVLQCDNLGVESGYEMMQQYLKDHDFPPQGVFTSGDYLAIGAIRALREAGLSIPEDVGVVGSTGLESSAHSYPSLSVITQPMEAIGTKLAEMAMQIIRTGNTHIPAVQIPGEMIFRESFPMPEK